MNILRGWHKWLVVNAQGLFAVVSVLKDSLKKIAGRSVRKINSFNFWKVQNFPKVLNFPKAKGIIFFNALNSFSFW